MWAKLSKSTVPEADPAAPSTFTKPAYIDLNAKPKDRYKAALENDGEYKSMVQDEMFLDKENY